MTTTPPAAEPKPFRYYVRVRYQDCDSQHVVFNARYGDYLDLAITEFLAASMPGRDPFNGTFEIQLKTQTIEWFAPARFQDVIEISTHATRFGRSSFNMRFELRIAGRGDQKLDQKRNPEPIVTAETVYVHVAGANGVWKSTPVPDDARALLAAGGRGKIVDHAGFYPIVRPQP